MDCMDGMAQFPDKYFDLAVVDPPYGIGLDMIFNGAHGKEQGGKEKKYMSYIHEKKEWNNVIPNEEYFIELYRVSKNQIIWGCNYYAKFIPAVGRIIHDKIMGIEGTKINFSHADIASCSLQKRITIFRYRWSGNKQGDKVNWENIGENSRIHPTQKPIQLYEYCLKNYAKPGMKIIDTHAGSCSSVIAFLDFDCQWIAFEIDKDYYEAASKRIENHKLQLKLF
jgi:site-specific DNA-methyltransferase (adenine-specific)